ncbi:uncharacterized protein LOC125763517 [Anopheles funestus]|uniref:BED-type domain-containing protein n=1 Tax=Anopheles funestus TaxID=62324 RepID=A0A4Y0BPK0_ANOFN|nr:uncharacterized protein LOC125763517 [Anopheles funestus]
MPSQLQSNAIVWLYFTNDTVAKKGKCVFCEQLISYEKSTFSNLTRHLKRRHPDVLKNGDKRHLVQPRVHYVWNYFEKESDTRAKCVRCQTYISCPNSAVGNLIRHMRCKHPTIPMENQYEFIQQEEDRLYDEPHSLSDAIEETFKGPSSLNESDLEMETNLNAIEMMPDNREGSVKIEYVNTNRKINEDDQEEVIEEIVHEAQTHPDVDMECRNDTDTTSQFLNQSGGLSYIQAIQKSKQVSQQEASIKSNRHESIAAIRTDEGSIGQHNFLKSIKDANVRSAAYATNIALELESLQPRQRIVAEKLISDVLFNAKLENLTEHSMVLAKLIHPTIK